MALLSGDVNRLKKLTIYNRWGQLIFETNDINKRWDGKYKKLLQPPGIYIYYVEMENLKGKRITKKGSVTLIR